jgi:hypothetical protein
MRTAIEAPRFRRVKKRLPPETQRAVDVAVRGIIAEPLSGEPKVGALKGVRVVKFKVGRQEGLLAYEFHAAADRLNVLDLGSHENFYRDLQRSRRG